MSTTNKDYEAMLSAYHRTHSKRKHSASPRWLLLALFGLSYTFMLSGLAYAHTQEPASIVRALLDIAVNPQNEFYGSLKLDLTGQAQNSTSTYVILPFRILTVGTNTEEIQVAYTVTSEGYTLLNMILTPTTPPGSEVSFRIVPEIQPDNWIPPFPGRSPNLFIVQNHDGGRNTLYFRFDAQASGQSFGKFSKFVTGMNVPTEVDFRFPTETTFYTTPPTYSSSNILAGNYPGIQRPNDAVFVTTTDFFRDKHLWINYSLPVTLPPLSQLVYIIVIGLGPLGALILALPQEILSKTGRLRLATGCIVITPVLLMVHIAINGTGYLIANLLSFVPSATVYFLTLGLLIMSWPLTERILKRFFHKQLP